MTSGQWSKHDEEFKAKVLAAYGEMTAREAGLKFGLTRNAVIGLWHRAISAGIIERIELENLPKVERAKDGISAVNVRRDSLGRRLGPKSDNIHRAIQQRRDVLRKQREALSRARAAEKLRNVPKVMQGENGLATVAPKKFSDPQVAAFVATASAARSTPTLPQTRHACPTSRRVNINDLKRFDCRWVEDGHYCGHKTSAHGGSFCDHHAERAYQFWPPRVPITKSRGPIVVERRERETQPDLTEMFR